MNTTVIECRTDGIEPEQAKTYLHIQADSSMSEQFDEWYRQARLIAKPKAAYTPLDVRILGENSVKLGETVFESRLLSSNLSKIGRVFAYAATCGTELEQWSEQFKNDPMDRFLSDSIKQMILYGATEDLFRHLEETYELGKTATMNPGSLPDWPISEQARLLPLIGDTEALIGVSLTDSFLLVPMKSVSGILFPTDTDYVNCMLCTKKDCVGRRAPFNAQLYREKLGKQSVPVSV